jgi:hypothetical protein
LALAWSKGFAAEETKTAFARARVLRESASSYYGQWVSNHLRGEVGLAQQTAELFLRDAEKRERMLETAVAHRVLGMPLHCQANLSTLEHISTKRFGFMIQIGTRMPSYSATASTLLLARRYAIA